MSSNNLIPTNNNMGHESGALGPFNTWLFLEEAFLKKCPSRKQLTVTQELKTREAIHDFLIRLGMSLKLEGKSILAAAIYVARFYMRFPITSSKYFVASSAMGISCKLYDNYRPLDKIALVACGIKNPNKTIDEQSEVFWQWRDQLLYREELILRHLNFDLDIQLPYTIKDDLMEKLEPDETIFYKKIGDILRNTISLIELLSSLPILVAYDMRAVFGSMLVYVVYEIREKFEEIVTIPQNFLESKLRVDLRLCYRCYKYVMTLLSFCDNPDPRLHSHKNALKRMKHIDLDTFISVANTVS
ncbi:uncharacterized protein PRCAT00001295001 [Priceomyces carsonii]|uniref:uncharacterized protein n=1 Tax=Priceomyces carsonii TaxID=28549 RepID=UPI002ED8F2D2|nr:unnamed protein product [Priceomyces carsonii]